MMIHKNRSKKNFIVFFRDYFTGNMRYVVWLLILILVGVGITNVNPYIYGKIIDFTSAGNLPLLLRYILFYAVITAVSTGMGMMESYYGKKLSYIITRKAQQQLYSKILYLKCEGLDKYSVGELLSRLNSDTNTIIDFYLNFITSIFTVVMNLVVSIAFIFRTSVELSIVSILFIPLSIWSNLIFRKKFKRVGQLEKEFGDRFLGFSVNSLSNITGIKAYLLENLFVKKYQNFLEEKWSISRKGITLQNQSGAISTLISTTSLLVTIYLSALLIIKKLFTIGSMVSFQTYIGRLNDAVSNLLSLNIQSQKVLVSMERIEKMGLQPDEMALNSLPPSQELPFQKIEVSHLTFRYKNNAPVVLDDFSFLIDAPGLYSVVGLNGCGKSSLLKLIVRFYEGDSGTILIDGKNINDINLGTLRSNIFYVAKDTYFADDSFLNNLRFGCQNVTDEEILAACKQVALDDFIESLPEKYETILGENGKFLSSGQKQKISVARAILRRSKIMLFDEITSDLDGKVENEIMKIIEALAANHIIILVTHRISSVLHSKKIFLLTNGKIVHTGKHEDLLRESELYRDMFLRQSPNE